MMDKGQKAYDRWVVFLLVGIGVFMCTLDGSIVNIALPPIMKDLGCSLSAVEWVPAVYLLTVSSLLLTFGRLSDIRGRRRVYSIGFLIFAAGSLFCGAAGSVGWLIGARCFQGIGAAMLMACSPALITDAFPPEQRGRALGLIGAVVATGLTLGPALGGMIIHWFSWRLIFYVNIPIGIGAALTANLVLRGGRADSHGEEPFDLRGAVLLTLCLGAFLTVLIQGYAWGYASVPVLPLMLLFILSGAGLVWIERGASHPVVDLSLFSIRLFSLPIVSAVLMFGALFVMIFLMPFYLMMPRGLLPREAGFMMMMPFAFLFVVSPLSGHLSDRIGSRMLCTAGLGFLGCALFLLALIPDSAPLFSIAWRLSLAGLGVALFISPNSSVAMGAVAPNRRGQASGMVAAARNFGMVFGIALAGAVFNSRFLELSQGRHLSAYAPELSGVFMASFKTAMCCGGAVALAGMVAAYSRGPEGKTPGEAPPSRGGGR